MCPHIPRTCSYKSMHGKFVLHPFIPDRRIPIITDAEAVDMTFGAPASQHECSGARLTVALAGS